MEQMVAHALQMGKYTFKAQARIGRRLGAGRHIVDYLVTDSNGKSTLVSLKWQQTPGTAEQKVPFEVMSLSHAISVSEGNFTKAYLVLGGSGWKLREFYLSGGLKDYLKNVDDVQIMGLEDFVGLANQGRL